MKSIIVILGMLNAFVVCAGLTYPLVDTGQKRTFDNSREISYPKPGRAYYGQDAQYSGRQPKYKVNRNGTVLDFVTGLTWQQDPGGKKTYRQAVADAQKCRVGGYRDWRLPTIKELYSLIDFSGADIGPESSDDSKKPFIDSRYFKFKYGNQRNERIIDSQYATSTKYVSTTMNGNATMFGVNFADGRIKGYPANYRKKYYVMYVRGNKDYGKNKFKNNRDGTVTDQATGLMWSRSDSGKGMNWKQALSYAENMKYAGYSDWRLPNAKELQSIVDYTRSPDTTGSAAINPIFKATSIANEGGEKDFPYYWTSTTHKSPRGGNAGVYIAFGRALGWMKSRRTGNAKLMDVHGAGAQRSDPKSGNPKYFPHGRGPQGDVIRIYNYVRLVRGGNVRRNSAGPAVSSNRSSYQRGLNDNSTGGTGRDSNAGAKFVRRLDRNGDGKVSKNEFDGPSNHFSNFDRNGDGYISSDEAPTGPPPQRGGRARTRGRGGL